MSRPVRFLQLTTFYPPYGFGGDAQFLYRLCHALGDAGHLVDVVHCVDSYHLLHPGEPDAEFPAHPRVTTHPLRSRYGALSPMYTHQTGRLGFKRRAIQAILDSKPFDVMHFHNVSLLGPQSLTLKSSRHDAIKLYTAHEHWLVCPMHVLWKYNQRLCERPDCARCMLRAKRPPQLWRHTDRLRRAAEHIDVFVSPSRFAARTHNDRGFGQSMMHLPNFVARSQDAPAHPHVPNQRPYFLFVGRLETVKGLQSIIPLWQHVTADVDLVIAGTGSLEQELRQLAASNRRIRFLGEIAPQHLSNWYANALACIVPSICYEVFGIVIIEAFAARTPVIVRDLGALAELVADSGGGLVFTTEREFLDAVHRLAQPNGLRNRLGESGYQAYRANWTPASHLQRYLQLLEDTALRKYGAVPWKEAAP